MQKPKPIISIEHVSHSFGDKTVLDDINLVVRKGEFVTIARTIVNEPQVLLLDEPLAALDLKMRKDMQMEIRTMHKKLGITFVYVTHDQEEALTLSDTIVVIVW